MKRLFILVLIVISVASVFASELIKVDELDDFGDPTGGSYITFDNDLSGTYKTSSVSNGILKWNMIIDCETGRITFIIKEKGKNADITTGGRGSSNSHQISFKNGNNEVYTKRGSLIKSQDYVWNALEISGWDCRAYLVSNKELKIVIKSDYGSYSLGSVKFDKLKTIINGESLDYHVGMIGPAGGYIFYDCDADNNSGNADGLVSSECGWRYLETAPEDLSTRYPFGYYRPDGKTNTKIGTVERIGRGKSNTEALVSSMGDEVYMYDTRGSYAAFECYNYSIESGGKIYDDWFLPSKEELNLVYINLHKKGAGNFQSALYWSSSEYSSNHAWVQYFDNGYQDDDIRYYYNFVRPIRAFM